MSADAGHLGTTTLGLVDHEGPRRQGLPLLVGEAVHVCLREAAVADLHRRTGLGGQQLGRRRRAGHVAGRLGDGRACVDQVQIHLMNPFTSRRPGGRLKRIITF